MPVIFSKPLSNTDVKNRLAIPTENLHDFPEVPPARDIGLDVNRLAIPTENLHDFEEVPPGRDIGLDVNVRVIDETGRPWDFRLSTRNKGGHPKPVISGLVWKEYVRMKELREGDLITFSNDEGIIRISSERRLLRLFGANIYAPIAE